MGERRDRKSQLQSRSLAARENLALVLIRPDRSLEGVAGSALSPGDRVLYRGVGTDEDAILAARGGVHVTCIAIADEMLARAERKFAMENLDGEFVCADVTMWQPGKAFDAVRQRPNRPRC